MTPIGYWAILTKAERCHNYSYVTTVVDYAYG